MFLYFNFKIIKKYYVCRLQAGCPTTIEIPTTDPDGDRVRCRFSETADECGDVCQHFPFFTFIEVCLF